MITKTQIKALFPNAKSPLVSVIVDHWDEAEAIGITKQRRIADFFAQIGTETGGLTSVSESLNYSVDALLKKFGRHRISEADARRLGRQKSEKALSIERQRAIANTLYGGEWGRKNLGNTKPNDGWDMRGGGMLQTTGRAGYARMGFENNPEALREPLTAFRTALREWDKRGCNARADRGDTKGNRKAINGGAMGLDECLAFRAKAMTIFPPDARPARVAALISTNVEEVEVTDPIGADPAPDIPAEVFTDADRVKLAQQWLRNLNYMPIGAIDGEIGDQTRDAIRSYRAAKGLAPGDFLDFQLMGTLATDTEPRPISEQRANASAADVRAKAPEVRANFLTKVWSGLSAAGAFLVTFGDGVVSNLSGAKGYVEPVKEFFGDVPAWGWSLIVFAVAVVIFRASAAGEKAGIAAVQTGARR
ncbi:MAG: hypothetical protein DI527_00830 [Chelatococcus sp.]|nr:MAG: hypothetical protein DI527_00830 [Chelatococcus sp.]